MNQQQAGQASCLILIDGHALAYRMYFSLLRQGLRTSDGTPTWAVYGFMQILLEIIEKWRPKMIAVMFDRAAPTFRHEEFEAYKAQRAPMPDDLRPQIELIKDVVVAFGIPIYEKDGFEADDLIGAAACRAKEAGYDVLIVTGDKDSLQLVDDQVHILMPQRTALDLMRFDPAAVKAKYGLDPGQIADFKGLSGDPSDNIPGVPGIGEKRATELLQRFGTLENLLANLDQLKPGKMKQTLEENQDLARQCKRLATIDCEAPVELDLAACHINIPDTGKLMDMLGKLEFRTVLRRLQNILTTFHAIDKGLGAPAVANGDGDGGEEDGGGDDSMWFDFASMEQVTALEVPHTVVTTREQLAELVAALGGCAYFALDTETSSINVWQAELVGISFALPPEGDAELKAAECRAWYLPVGHQAIFGEQLPKAEVLEALRPVLEDSRKPKVMQNAKYDLHILANEGIRVRGLADDPMLADYVLDPERTHGLKDMALRYLNVSMTDISQLIGTGAKAISMDRVDIARAAHYAAGDAAATLELADLLHQRLEDSQTLELYQSVELPLVNVLLDMERAGIKVDLDYLRQLSARFEQRLRLLEADIHVHAGAPFNINSPKQLSTVLFDTLALSKSGVRKTQSGWYSTDAAVLERLSADHPMVSQLLEFRELSKLRGTYTEALAELVNPKTGRVHTTFNQTIAATGRLSSQNPNLQNIPVRSEVGREIRRAFVPESKDWVLMCADYSQIELRILAHLSDDPIFVEAFRSGQDIHTRTASDLFGVEMDKVTSLMRRVAKTTNFGILYGQSQFGLARVLGIPKSEAQKFITSFQMKYQGVYKFLLEVLAEAKHNGYVSTLTNRRRYIANINTGNRALREMAERMAINAPVQGSASDIIKLAMVRLHHDLQQRNLRSRMLLQVHDELVLEVPREELAEVQPLVREVMETAFPLKVPLEVGLSTGPSWIEAK